MKDITKLPNLYSKVDDPKKRLSVANNIVPFDKTNPKVIEATKI
jgi:hypothetical protein